ncbi:membrane protein [Porphyromonas macacae]|uniref:Membrane protein n=1 Tax=Porphyromonas macacae TaxID=28115 RepID=A0A0A2EBD8_9PORP|nr:OmpA family protein [Porphyromonas macacae]KGN74937.1 membrane protein [Porphyromonas macacae]
MKKISFGATFVAAALLISGCGMTLNNATKGAGIGLGAGAAIGAGIGKVAGNTGLGAAIGAAVGGTAGALIGNKMDKQKKELEATVPEAKIETINSGEAIRVTFESGILFKINSDALNAQSRESLNNFAKSLKNNPDTNVKIVGFTDTTGNDRINYPLSVNRAKSVYNYLLGKGINNARMTFDGKGSELPVASNDTEAGRRANRRVEIYIVPNEQMIKKAKQGTL